MKLKLLLFILVNLFVLQHSFSQNLVNARSTAMGGVGMAFQDVNSIHSNPAGIDFMKAFGAVVSAERRFDLADLNTYTLGLAIPTKNVGTFGLSVNYFGFEAFNQQKFGLLYARKFSSKFSFGGEINLHNFQIKEFGSTNTLSFELGIQYQVLNDLIVGAKIANPIERDLANGEHLPTEFRLGLFYKVASKVNFALEAEKQLDFDPNIKAGIEYQIIDILFARIGIGTNPSLVSFGIGLNVNSSFSIDIASSFHQQLGWSPGISMIYQGATKRKK